MTKKTEKFKVVRHCYRETAVNAFMVASDKRAICGGNLHAMIPYHIMLADNLIYPTVFKSRGEGNRFISLLEMRNV